MKQIIVIFVIFLYGGLFAYTQSRFHDAVVEQEFINGDEGYYISNSVVYHGVWFSKDNRKDRAKRVIIPQQKKHEAKTFYPEDIEEYGFLNGIKYVSATLNFNGEEKNVFLEEIANIKDSIFLFIYCTDNNSDVFFILENSENKLKKIDTNSPEEVWDKLKTIYNCNDVLGMDKFPNKLTRKRVFVFFNAYKDCNPNLFPKFQFGPIVNVCMSNPKLQETPSYTYKQDFAFSIGAFFQLPFDECIALRTEVVYSHIDNNTGIVDKMQKSKNETARYVRQSVQIPILVRYSFNFKAWKNVPYFQIGPCFDYAFKGEKYKDDVIQTHNKNNLLDDKSIINFLYGYSIGAGIEHKINHKRSIHLGLRNNWLTGSRQEYVEKINSFGLSCSVNF
ncbi:MAG: PorT family protein [Marinilabiliaceae bacterium]|nr:PorT family protein [Marinilabiliaceae bacterium]